MKPDFASTRIKRWTPTSKASVAVLVIILAVLAFGPILFSPHIVTKLTVLFIYIIIAVMWNAIAGYGGMISIGQQGFFGLGAYMAIRLADFGIDPYASLFIGAVIVGVISLPISVFMLRLREGEFAVGMWVLAELGFLLVKLDPIVHGETGTSLLELNAYPAELRRMMTYWAAFIAMVGFLAVMFVLLRSRIGTSIQAIRDDDEAAASVGVRVRATKRLIFFVSAIAAALAGALWLATTITFQPHAYFSVQWSAYMIFMVVVGGIGTFEGAIIGAVIFFLMELFLGTSGVWYLIAIGAASLLFALFLPKGIWGAIEQRFGLYLLPVGYRVISGKVEHDQDATGDDARADND